MTEAAQQPNQNSQVLNQAGTVNRVVPKKAVYMRNHEAKEFEKELETSRLNAENAGKQPSASPVNVENPNSANTSNPENVDWQKRYADIQSDRDRKLADANKKLADKDKENLELKNKLNETVKVKYPTSEKELEQWMKEFPPLVPIIQTLAMKTFEPEKEEIAKELKELQDFRKSIANERGRMELLKIHPDANEIEADPRFAQWFNEQESEIQSLINSGTPQKIAKAITFYKRDFNIVTKTAQDFQKDASRAINVGPNTPELPKEQKTWHESEVYKLSEKAYAHYEQEIEKARLEGRYVYDISRAS